MSLFPTLSRRVAAGLTAALLAGAVTGCTEEAAPPEPAATPPPSASTGTAATLEAKPVPLDVRTARVLGSKLSKRAQEAVERRAGRVIGEYFDRAFLEGSYPREGSTGAFASFSKGAAAQARRDAALVTGAGLGKDVTGVTPVAKQARLYVLAPNKLAAGVTARIRLVLVTQTEDGPGQRVTVTGRLMLGRKAGGTFEIFGYDVARSSVPAGKGATR